MRPRSTHLAAIYTTNAVLRVASTAAGQLFAFAVSDRVSEGSRPVVVAVTSGAFFASEVLFAPVGGRLADARGASVIAARAPLLGALSMLLTFALLSARSSSLIALVVALLAARALEGASAGLAVPSALLLLSDATRDDEVARSRTMALFEVLSLVAMILGFAVSGALWERLGPRSPLAFAALYLASHAVARTLPRSAPSQSARGSVRDALRAFVAQPSHRRFALAWLSVNAVVGAWFQHAPVLLGQRERHPTQALVGGLSPSRVGVVFAVWGALFLSGLALWAWRFARVERTRAMTVALYAMFGVCLALFAVNHGAPWWVLLVGCACVLVESGFTPAALGHLADVTEREPSTRGASVGLYSILLGVGQLVGSAASAPFVTAMHMDGVLVFTALCAGAALLALRGA